MTLLWCFVAAACLFAAAAGTQALWLLQDRDSAITRLELRLTTLQADVERAGRQIEAQTVQIATQRTVLERAEAWIKAQQAATKAAK